MASIYRTESGWRVQVRLQGRPSVSKVFRTKAEAVAWGRAQEVSTPTSAVTYADLAAKYAEFSRKGSKAKQNVLKRLLDYWGDWRLTEITTQTLADFAQRRRRDGAGGPTVLQQLSYLGTVVAHGGVLCNSEEAMRTKAAINAAIRTLRTTGTVADANQRSRRPTEDELQRIERVFDSRKKSKVPMMDITLFAIATTMRLGEIVGPGGIRWGDFDPEKRMILLRSRKDPRLLNGRDELVPLLKGAVTYQGNVIDPVEIMMRQPTFANGGRIFPWAENSVSMAFQKAARKADATDLHFHDLRHDGISRLFEAKYRIEEVAIVSGHKSWKNLKRYTHINPVTLHR